MKAEFINRLVDLKLPTSKKDIKELENALMTNDGINEAALDLSIRSLEGRKTDFSRFTVESLIRSYKDKLIASKGASCGLCDSSGWALVIVLDHRENRWLVNYEDPRRAFNYCLKVPRAKTDVTCVPCICSNGDKHNHKHGEEWCSARVRKMAGEYTPKGLDRVQANGVLRVLSDKINSQHEAVEVPE